VPCLGLFVVLRGRIGLIVWFGAGGTCRAFAAGASCFAPPTPLDLNRSLRMIGRGKCLRSRPVGPRAHAPAMHRAHCERCRCRAQLRIHHFPAQEAHAGLGEGVLISAGSPQSTGKGQGQRGARFGTRPLRWPDPPSRVSVVPGITKLLGSADNSACACNQCSSSNGDENLVKPRCPIRSPVL